MEQSVFRKSAGDKNQGVWVIQQRVVVPSEAPQMAGETSKWEPHEVQQRKARALHLRKNNSRHQNMLRADWLEGSFEEKDGNERWGWWTNEHNQAMHPCGKEESRALRVALGWACQQVCRVVLHPLQHWLDLSGPASSSGIPSRCAGVWSLSVLGDVQDQTGLGTVLSNRFCQPYFEQGNWTKLPEIPTLTILGLFLWLQAKWLKTLPLFWKAEGKNFPPFGCSWWILH